MPLRNLFRVGPTLATQCAVPRRINCLAVRPVGSQLLPSTLDSWSLDRQISHQNFLRKLEVIRKKLKEHLGEQEWPRLTHVDVAGLSVKLPLRADYVFENHIFSVQADLAYLAGFFDGDGCVGSESNLSGCQLHVGQRASNISVLLAFLCRFGGSICRLNSGKGMVRPQLQWLICGASARAAASELHEHCLVKKEQLGIAMNWPECRNMRKEHKLKLKALKKNGPNIARQVISWSYFTGFFDAEGCIRISPSGKNIRIEICQRDPPILHAMQTFLLDQLPDGSHVPVRRLSRYGHNLEVSSKKLVLHILEEMLINGLLVKRMTADHFLNSIDLTHDVLRGAEPNVKGNQSFLRRLDDAGCLRARNIQNLQTKCRYARVNGRSLIALELKDRLDDAKLEHAILSAMSQIQRLRSEIASFRSRARMGKKRSSSPDK